MQYPSENVNTEIKQLENKYRQELEITSAANLLSELSATVRFLDIPSTKLIKDELRRRLTKLEELEKVK